MSNAADYRKLMAEIGVDDDRIERALIDLLQEKDTELQLERDRVPEKVWELENRLMEMEVQNVTA